MKFGVNTFIWSATFDRSNWDLLPRIKEAGFDGIEVPLFRAADFAASDIRDGLSRYDLECTVVSVLSPDLNVASGDPAVRRKTQTHLEECVQAVAEAGSHLIAGPLYTPLGFLPGRRRTADEWKYAVECYSELGPVLERYDVTLAIEPLNRFETYFLNTAADAAALCSQVNHPRVGVLFDTFHANIEEKDIADGYRQLAGHLKHVHMCENDRGTPGTGHIDWPGVFQALRDVHYDGWLTIESFGFAIPIISAAAAIWRDIAPTPESIAFDGLQFLRSHSL
ncbi:MAG TPA: sugar phosphate isomerase/epimerase [Bryobacteraceae bacterium]|nr:sugar phosphate isomerase/epimerase [Bryobacteraceae bacterium]